MTRVACGGWCAPTFTALSPKAENMWIKASVPNPPPERNKKSRREKSGFISMHEHEFVAIQQHAAKIRQTVFFREAAQFFCLRGTRFSPEGEREGESNLAS